MNGNGMFRKRWPFHLTQRGFTLIEVLVIVIIVGVITAITAPSVSAMMDRIKVDRSVVEIRSILQESQRSAIRQSKFCTALISLSSEPGGEWLDPFKKFLCPGQKAPDIPEGVEVLTNIVSPSASASKQGKVVEVQFGVLGNAKFNVLHAAQIVKDPTGKIVAFIPTNSGIDKKCIAISSTLGLTRMGTYLGETDPKAITDTGLCTALDWQDQ